MSMKDMERVGEMLVVSDAGAVKGAVSLWDLTSAYHLTAYKGDVAAPHSLTLLKSDYLVYAAQHRPCFHIMPICKKQDNLQHVRVDVPGPVTALAASRHGDCIIAAVGEKVFLWQVLSGSLMAQITHLHGRITCIRFTDCGNHFVTGDTLGQVIAWGKASIVEDCLNRCQPSPSWKSARHSLLITDICMGSGGNRANLISASADHTCRIWDMLTGLLMSTLTFDAAVHSVAMDTMELLLFAGDQHGKIHRIKLCSIKSKEKHIQAGVDSTIYSGHLDAVTCLVISGRSLCLVSGSADRQVIVRAVGEDASSPMKIIEFSGPVTNLLIPDGPLDFSMPNPQAWHIPPFQHRLYSPGEPLTLSMFIGNGSVVPSSRLDVPAALSHRRQEASKCEEQSLQENVKNLQEANRELFGFIRDQLLTDS